MPGLAGIEVLKQVRKEGLATRIVLLTAAASDVELVAGVTNGAWGILPKELAADAVRDCLTKVAGGESWLPPELIDPAMSREAEWQKENEKIESLLTNRELEVSVLVSEGLSNKHIARHVGICEGTVKIHLYNAYRKLGGLKRASLTDLLTRYHHREPNEMRAEFARGALRAWSTDVVRRLPDRTRSTERNISATTSSPETVFR
jgi:two-component system nitrate/nitrite response regulator NarL